MMVTINPNDTADAVKRRYQAVYGADAYDRLGDDEDACQDGPYGYRARLLAKAHALLHREEGRSAFGELPEAPR